MNSLSRRTFLAGGTMAATAALFSPRLLHAATANPAIGLQLFSVREALAKDYAGALKQVAAIGYREVEAAGFYKRSASDVKQLMAAAGLKCVSAHYSLADLLKAPDETIDYAKTLGLDYVICSSPSVPDPSRLSKYPGGTWQGTLHLLTLDDWKWNADQFNQMGKKMQAAGLKFGYHNHTMEFRDLSGTTAFHVLLEETDPAYVTLELDCGWAIAAGQDPVALLTKYPTRFSLLHVKDLKPSTDSSAPDKRVSTELGLGTVDYKPIFAAARKAKIRHAFIEQEDFDEPVFEALKVDFNALEKLATT
jgi:sugar phosphate isomerase/epimerase